MAQRIVRAKKRCATTNPCRAATAPRATARLASVLQVIYLLFNEGYAATSGTDWARPDLVP